MQCAVIEFGRNVLELDGADSTEFNDATPHPVICMLEDQKSITNKGGTMRLGAQPCVLAEDSHAFECYGQSQVSERHRHRYEFNPEYREQFINAGMVATGNSPSGNLVEIVELKNHPWFVAVQFHPEFQSKPATPHPLFQGFVKAALEYHRERIKISV
jgi:CTP synthase